MKRVQEWLNGSKNFIIGRAIYRAIISSNDELIQSLDKGFTHYSHQQLIKAMEAHIQPPAAIQQPKQAAAAPQQQKKQETQYNDEVDNDVKPIIDPLVLKAINNEWQIPYKKMHYLIAQLDQFGDANDPAAIASRMDLAEQILALEQQVNSIWAKKDEYEKTGSIITPVVDELVIPTDPVELAELINRTKKGIRNNRIRMQQFPDKPGYAERYQNYKFQYLKITGKHYQDKV